MRWVQLSFADYPVPVMLGGREHWKRTCQQCEEVFWYPDTVHCGREMAMDDIETHRCFR